MVNIRINRLFSISVSGVEKRQITSKVLKIAMLPIMGEKKVITLPKEGIKIVR